VRATVPTMLSGRRHQPLLPHGPQYMATASLFYAHELGLVPITTPAYSPESYELRDAESVLARLGGWFDDYAPICLGLWGADQP
jgi:hypothetical protein